MKSCENCRFEKRQCPWAGAFSYRRKKDGNLVGICNAWEPKEKAPAEVKLQQGAKQKI